MCKVLGVLVDSDGHISFKPSAVNISTLEAAQQRTDNTGLKQHAHMLTYRKYEDSHWRCTQITATCYTGGQVSSCLHTSAHTRRCLCWQCQHAWHMYNATNRTQLNNHQSWLLYRGQCRVAQRVSPLVLAASYLRIKDTPSYTMMISSNQLPLYKGHL